VVGDLPPSDPALSAGRKPRPVDTEPYRNYASEARRQTVRMESFTVMRKLNAQKRIIRLNAVYRD
jgi:hypothetical protein